MIYFLECLPEEKFLSEGKLMEKFSGWTKADTEQSWKQYSINVKKNHLLHNY